MNNISLNYFLITFCFEWNYFSRFFLVHGRTAGAHGAGRGDRAQELDRVLIQQLRDRCEHQALQLQSLQAQLKKADLCMDVFSITTQHFCHKVSYSKAVPTKKKKLSPPLRERLWSQRSLCLNQNKLSFKVTSWHLWLFPKVSSCFNMI